MTLSFHPFLAQRLRVSALAALLCIVMAPASAAPGAHGPNGEHLDSPAALPAALSLPRIEAQSDSFELVAELRAGELVILVDRHATNEPVLGARLDVESGALKAVARFRPEQGDYVVTDAALLKALAARGEHGLVFTLVAGKDSDLLDGTLVNSAAAKNQHQHGHDGHGHGHDHGLERAAWIGAGVSALGLMLGVAWWRQRRRHSAQPQGGL